MGTRKHPHVSEENEGRPAFEWVVAVCVVVAAVVAFLGHTALATALLAAVSILTGLIRLVLRSRSPWKVRSVSFDVFISIALGIGLLVTYASIELML
ncbi:hypothetical protein [Bifidobacterium bombi]|uniref:Rod shape-determining protein RodA n=1 Tax=Bifidobacterium bombi DSM 19703 TaxID=1341695 RepID=A0A080N2K6_9BIFI|nr:hypothetical protein [Bifidobacterium bombi]KFF31233.1 hypothetical protein BBOMB_0572 [Bifidobacterium bombi DSM 19703]